MTLQHIKWLKMRSYKRCAHYVALWARKREEESEFGGSLSLETQEMVRLVSSKVER